MNIVTDSGQARSLKNQVVHLNSSQRLKHSIKGAGLYLGLALISVFIPVFHFILVPLFLLLSLWTGFSHYRNTKFINLQGVNCPACEHTLKESGMYFKDEPPRLYCYECRKQMWLKND